MMRVEPGEHTPVHYQLSLYFSDQLPLLLRPLVTDVVRLQEAHLRIKRD